MKLAYAFVIGDLFHYGHLRLLQEAAELADRLICGVLTDKAVAALGEPTIASFEERKAVIQAIRCVDEVVAQEEQDPTQALRKIRKRYPDAELVFVYGDNWKQVPGETYLRSIKATFHQQRFYHRLSKERVAAMTIARLLPDGSTIDTFTDSFVVDGLAAFKGEKPTVVVSTKARTLQRLKPLLKKSRIEPLYIFTVRAWSKHRQGILRDIVSAFPTTRVVVRSSSVNEDSLTESKAGYYRSELGISTDDPEELGASVDRVIASYGDSGEALWHTHQVLIQRQTTGVRVSGVVFTRDLGTNAPYYVINYCEGDQTEAITSGGTGALLKVFHGVDRTTLEAPWPAVLEAVDELERIIPSLPLDIEFAVVGEDVVLFQVRPLAANTERLAVSPEEAFDCLEQIRRTYSRLREEHGASLVLSDMLLWNPAELIGHRPAPLAYDLFERVIMRRAWKDGLTPLGYPDLGARLLERLAYKPYINVSVASRTLIPNVVPAELHAPIERCVLAGLQADPSLHDKAEFQLLFSCYDFDLGPRLKSLMRFGVHGAQAQELEAALADWTRDVVVSHQHVHDSLCQRIRALNTFNQTSLELRRRELWDSGPVVVEAMLDRCEEDGAIPFATAARLAFVAEALLRSLVPRGVVDSAELDLLLGSFSTVATELTTDLTHLESGKLGRVEFLARYGHLRAGTWEITQPRYDSAHSLTQLNSTPSRPARPIPSALLARIDAFLQESPLGVSVETLLAFSQTFIGARERFKFVFTRTLSDTLELLKELGAARGLVPEQLRFLGLENILAVLEGPAADAESLATAKASEFRRLADAQLPPVVFDESDFFVLRFPVSSPTFVTTRVVTGEIVELEGGKADLKADLEGRIVLIERADPGYHWLFSRGIGGLVTKYGGAASHMAICCAELNIPAAIGCGERYDSIRSCREVVLDCAGQRLGSRG